MGLYVLHVTLVTCKPWMAYQAKEQQMAEQPKKTQEQARSASLDRPVADRLRLPTGTVLGLRARSETDAEIVVACSPETVREWGPDLLYRQVQLLSEPTGARELYAALEAVLGGPFEHWYDPGDPKAPCMRCATPPELAHDSICSPRRSIARWANRMLRRLEAAGVDSSEHGKDYPPDSTAASWWQGRAMQLEGRVEQLLARVNEGDLYLYRCVHCRSITILGLNAAQMNCACGNEFYPMSRKVELGQPIPIGSVGGEALGDGGDLE